MQHFLMTGSQITNILHLQYVSGAALIAFQLFTNLAETAERLNELELRSTLQANAELVLLLRKLDSIFRCDSPD